VEIERPDDETLDELDELIAERAEQNSNFPAMVEVALERRRVARAKRRREEHTQGFAQP
jgi:hypothetical protein